MLPTNNQAAAENTQDLAPRCKQNKQVRTNKQTRCNAKHTNNAGTITGRRLSSHKGSACSLELRDVLLHVDVFLKVSGNALQVHSNSYSYYAHRA